MQTSRSLKTIHLVSYSLNCTNCAGIGLDAEEDYDYVVHPRDLRYVLVAFAITLASIVGYYWGVVHCVKQNLKAKSAMSDGNEMLSIASSVGSTLEAGFSIPGARPRGAFT